MKPPMKPDVNKNASAINIESDGNPTGSNNHSTTNNACAATSTATTKSKIRLVVKAKRKNTDRIKTAKRITVPPSVKTSQKVTNGSSQSTAAVRGGVRIGLPSRTIRTRRTSIEDDDNEDTNNHAHVVDEDEFLALSDALMAIHSMQQESQGLHIPTSGGHTVQVVLESQLYQRFQESHASTICQELRSMTLRHQVKTLRCWGLERSGGSSNTRKALILTSDYVSAVWTAHEQYSTTMSAKMTDKEDMASTTLSASACRPSRQQVLSREDYQHITAWFVKHVSTTWTETTITMQDLQEAWQDVEVPQSKKQETVTTPAPPCVITLEHAIYHLQVRLQVLMRSVGGGGAAAAHVQDAYHLWLPNWGLVLKGWSDARCQLIAQLKRSRGIGGISTGRGGGKYNGTTTPGRGEVSERRLLETNRHSCVSTHFLVQDLLSQGTIRRVQRPFGTFLQLK